MPARCIHLRRPATLSIQSGVVVPDVSRAALDEAERRWRNLCAHNPAYYDGRLYHVLGVHRNGHGGATMHVIDCAYRFFAVQDHKFDLGIRPLGVKGIVERDGRYLFGRRAGNVAAYQGLWELAPAGSVEPPHEPAAVIQQELIEETGMTSTHEPISVAVLFDPVLRCWELVFRLQIGAQAPAARSSEYTALIWCTREKMPHDLSPIAKQIAALL